MTEFCTVVTAAASAGFALIVTTWVRHGRQWVSESAASRPEPIFKDRPGTAYQVTRYGSTEPIVICHSQDEALEAARRLTKQYDQVFSVHQVISAARMRDFLGHGGDPEAEAYNRLRIRRNKAPRVNVGPLEYVRPEEET